MFKTPYETTLCKGLAIDNITRQLQRSYVTDMLILSDNITGTQVKGVYVVPPSNNDIPQFKHPILFFDPSDNRHTMDDVKVAVYGKGWVRENLTDKTLRIPNTYDSGVPLMAAALTRAWNQHSPLDLLNVGDYVGKVFTSWVSFVVAQREALSPEAAKWVNCYVALYWLCLFEDEMPDFSNEAVLRKYVSKVGMLTRVNTADIYDRFSNETFTQPETVHGLAMLIARADPVRLERFNAGTLLSYLQNTFMGTAHRENVAIGLEFPPMFNALLYQALTDRSYRKSKIGELAELKASLQERETYIRNLFNLINA